MANSWRLFKCKLENETTDIVGNRWGWRGWNYKHTRWLPNIGAKGGACEVVPIAGTEQNWYYLHRTCPWYNSWSSSESCDSILYVGQWLGTCQQLLNDWYFTWWGVSQQH